MVGNISKSSLLTLQFHSPLFTPGLLGVLLVAAGALLDPSAWISGLNKDLKWLSGLRSTVQWESHVDTVGVYGCNYVWNGTVEWKAFIFILCCNTLIHCKHDQFTLGYSVSTLGSGTWKRGEGTRPYGDTRIDLPVWDTTNVAIQIHTIMTECCTPYLSTLNVRIHQAGEHHDSSPVWNVEI